jgi:hypothetical protein
MSPTIIRRYSLVLWVTFRGECSKSFYLHLPVQVCTGDHESSNSGFGNNIVANNAHGRLTCEVRPKFYSNFFVNGSSITYKITGRPNATTILQMIFWNDGAWLASLRTSSRADHFQRLI